MKNLVASLSLILAATFMMGCSTRKLEGDPQLDSSLMMDILSYTLGNEAQGFADGSDVIDQMVQEDPKSTIFFAQSDESRPAVSVISLNDLTWVNNQFAGESIFDLGAKYAYSFFIDGVDADGNRRFGLALLMEGYGGGVLKFSSVSEVGDYKFTDDSFQTAIRGANGERVVLKSKNVSPDYAQELGTAVMLEVWVDGYYAGQISPMTAYGGIQ